MKSLLPIILLVLLTGCPKNGADVSEHVGGFGAMDSGLKQIDDGLTRVKSAPLNANQAAGASEIQSGEKDVRTGESDAVKQVKTLTKENDSSRQWLYRVEDVIRIIAALAIVAGIALGVHAFLDGGKVQAGAGVLIAGLAGALVFGLMRISDELLDKLMPWLVGCGAALIVTTAGIFVYFAIRYLRERKLTTEVAANIPPGQLANLDVSETTKKLLMDAKQAVQAKSDAAVT
jgi:hypothetical protein